VRDFYGLGSVKAQEGQSAELGGGMNAAGDAFQVCGSIATGPGPDI
jgi:hypothetical protein